MTFKNNRTPLLSMIKLCASFHCHMWIQTGVTVRKRLKWGHDLCDLDLRPLTLTFRMDITSVNGSNFMMIRWQEHDEKGVADRQTDRQTDWTIHRAVWSQLKIWASIHRVGVLPHVTLFWRRTHPLASYNWDCAVIIWTMVTAYKIQLSNCPTEKPPYITDDVRKKESAWHSNLPTRGTSD